MRGEIAEGSLGWRPLPGPALVRDRAIARRPDRPLGLAGDTFAELCRSAVRDFEADAGALSR